MDRKNKKLKDIAEKKWNCTMSQLAVAWIIKNPDVTTCLLRCTKFSQLDDSLKGYEVYKKLDKEIWLEIEKILDNAPQGEIDYRYFSDMPVWRNQFLGIDYMNNKNY